MVMRLSEQNGRVEHEHGMSQFCRKSLTRREEQKLGVSYGPYFEHFLGFTLPNGVGMRERRGTLSPYLKKIGGIKYHLSFVPLSRN